MFGVKNVLSAWQVSSLDSGISFGQGNQELGRNSVSGSTETPVRDRVQLRILESGKKMTRCREPTCQDKVGLPQHANLPQSIP